MSQREIAFEIEDLQIAAEEINSMQNALFAALYESTYAKEDLRQAFRAFGGMTYKLQTDLKDLMNRAFENVKDQKNTNLDVREKEDESWKKLSGA